MSLTDTRRQDALLKRLSEHVEDSVAFGALVVVGSFASRTADAVSDLDLFFITYRGRFKDVWNRRRDLHVTGEIVEWDLLNANADAVGGHRWISPDLVLVEAVISEPDGGGRIAEPFELVTGDPQLLKGFPRRKPVDADKNEDC
jgi:hypothetical protein